MTDTAYAAEQRAHRLAGSLRDVLEILGRVAEGGTLHPFDEEDIKLAEETLAEDGEV